MKIAISSTSKNKDANIDEKAGRAKYYLIFDESGEIIEIIDNPFRTGGGGAGFGVAKMLADKGVNTIVAGEFGPNMIQAMTDRKIAYISKSGTVEDFISSTIKKNK